MKKLFSIEILWTFIISTWLLLAPMVSAADHYILNFESPQTTVKLYLSIDPDTEVDEASGSQEDQEPSSGLLSSDNAKTRKPKTIGGLPISETKPSAQRQTLGLTPAADENQECGAVGGLPVSRAIEVVSSSATAPSRASDDGVRATASDRPLTSQPAAVSKHSVYKLPTGTATVTAWLERIESGASVPVIHIPLNQLQTLVRLFASLVAMEADEMYACQPYPRCGICVSDPEALEHNCLMQCSCGNQVCDSVVNPSWSRGKYVVLSALCLTGIGSGAGFGAGMTKFGAGCLTSGLFSSALAALYFSHTRFSNQFQVSFTFDSASSILDIDRLQQIRLMLQCTGGYDLVSYTLGETSQTLSFNIWTSKAVNADQLKTWFDNRNQQWSGPYQIEICPISRPTSIEPSDTDTRETKL